MKKLKAHLLDHISYMTLIKFRYMYPEARQKPIKMLPDGATSRRLSNMAKIQRSTIFQLALRP